MTKRWRNSYFQNRLRSFGNDIESRSISFVARAESTAKNSSIGSARQLKQAGSETGIARLPREYLRMPCWRGNSLRVEILAGGLRWASRATTSS